MNLSVFLPGIVFQSILIGGGYITGREVVEYFLDNGQAAWLVVAIVTIGFFACMYMALELARITSSFHYTSWSSALLKKSAFAFEVLFVAMAILVLAIVISAASSVISELANVTDRGLAIFVAILVSTIVLLGERSIERLKVAGTLFLYICFGVFLYVLLRSSNAEIGSAFQQTAKPLNAISDGLTYIGYNFVAIPAAIFAAQGLKSKNETIVAAAIGAILGVVPMAMLVSGIGGLGGDVLAQALPLKYALQHASNEAWIISLYGAVLFVALIETAVGMSFALSKRVELKFPESNNKNVLRFVSAFALIMAAVLLSHIGVINLVAKGYSYMAWGFFVVAVVPLLYWFLFKRPVLVQSD